jgi:hypothetical protein
MWISVSRRQFWNRWQGSNHAYGESVTSGFAHTDRHVSTFATDGMWFERRHWAMKLAPQSDDNWHR